MSEKYKIRDQTQPYFITFATTGWVDVFTRSQYADIFLDSIRYCQKEKGLEVYAWCIMSNHIHLIIGTTGKNKIEDIVRDFKKYTSVHICRAIANNKRESRREWMLSIFHQRARESSKHQKYAFWQNEYHPIELSDNRMMDQRLDYIHNNPVKAGLVYEPSAYVYSSAVDYAGGKGLLDLVMIG
ncbi:MAG: transposase [Reichenbachiella sp.]|uniref:REP-associated tyrosine transposase n=1 Tax=Reichenbachiella sp. TaxID=2184521 RepID=UPI003263F695